jgi:DegV family protein with EDD domain
MTILEVEYSAQACQETEDIIEKSKRVGQIAVVTDSASSLPLEIAAAHSIAIVPIYLHWGSETYRDGVDITPEEVYRRLEEYKQIPRTAAPSVGDFLRVYMALSEEVEGIVSIHLPEKLSGVVKSARIAAELVKEVIPVEVIDTGTAAMAAGFVALAAARVAEQGMDMVSIREVAGRVSSKATVLAMLDTLEYLQRGGRIGKAAALLGIALKIRPILYVNDHVVDVMARPRTFSQGIKAMVAEMERRVGDHPVHVAILHANALDRAHDLRDLVEERFHCIEVFTCPFTPVMGAHTGPGVVGLAFYAEE